MTTGGGAGPVGEVPSSELVLELKFELAELGLAGEGTAATVGCCVGVGAGSLFAGWRALIGEASGLLMTSSITTASSSSKRSIELSRWRSDDDPGVRTMSEAPVPVKPRMVLRLAESDMDGVLLGRTRGAASMDRNTLPSDDKRLAITRRLSTIVTKERRSILCRVLNELDVRPV